MKDYNELMEEIKEKCGDCEAWSGTDCTRNPYTQGCLKDEKKLTDEEVLTAIEKCFAFPMKCEGGCPYFNKNGRNFCVENKAFYKDLKRIVTEHTEQKAEIERLTEERDLYKDQFNELEPKYFDFRYENAELQKQVEELTKSLNRVMAEHDKMAAYAQSLEERNEQAVKDTAKEIANWLVTTESNKEELAKIIKEHYGVEVEL